tara:strand:- start:772 stop:1110 length:339 start_codon:yes stop_codon:yes gene_type:complete
MKNSRRQNRTRYKLKKVTDRKRLSVFKSNNHIYAQVINDKLGTTLASASSMESNIRKVKLNKKELAEKIGSEIAKRSIENGVKEVAFDKGKYKYHGIVKIIAEAARAAGLNF